MENKYQNALNWIKFELKHGVAPDTYFRKVEENIGVLQELIDRYAVYEEYAKKMDDLLKDVDLSDSK